ncbi:MAG: YncE family protein [Acidobacteriota bacterium]
MQIKDVVVGLAAGVGVDLSPDGKTAYYVEWSIGVLSKVDVGTGMVTTVQTGLAYPEDVEVDWGTGEIFVSERTGAVVRIWPGEKTEVIAEPGGAPQQLALVKKGSKRFLYTVCYDSGRLVRIDVAKKTIKTIASGLGHPVGLVIDTAQKYAYVTEQDKNALTRIELANGAASQVYAGLVSPFFLAWDKDAKDIFCVQRDPANSLVRIALGSPATLSVVAGGLAWRPSGVAPNADNKLIYICADRELEVICFNGGPPIKPPKPPFEIYSIRFNYDKSPAIKLKDHVAGAPVPLPEYVKGVRNGPAAYVAATLPHIKVVLKKLSGYVSGAYEIGATGSLGGVRRKTVTPVFQPSGLSTPIDFELMWPLPGTVGKPDVTLDWYARKSPGPSIPVLVGSASHRIYLVLAKPTEPWVTETPWVDALKLGCGWAAGAANLDAAATAITERYYNSGKVSYDTVQGMTVYQFNNYAGFFLSEMIERLNGGVGLGEKVNCTDSANTVSTLVNLLGCDLWQSRMGSSFYMNPILAIGCSTWVPPFWGGFGYHEVAWKGACTENDNLFDGCLMVDGDADPTTAPQTPLLPTNMLFGDCTTMNYRLRLCPPGASACGACQPQPGTKKRRPLK